MIKRPSKLLSVETLDEIERVIRDAPPPVKPPVDPAEERRKLEAFRHSLDEVEAALTGREVRRRAE